MDNLIVLCVPCFLFCSLYKQIISMFNFIQFIHSLIPLAHPKEVIVNRKGRRKDENIIIICINVHFFSKSSSKKFKFNIQPSNVSPIVPPLDPYAPQRHLLVSIEMNQVEIGETKLNH